MYLSERKTPDTSNLAALLTSPTGKIGLYYETQGNVLSTGSTNLNDIETMRQHNRRLVDVWFRSEAIDDWLKPELVISRALKTIDYAPAQVEHVYDNCTSVAGSPGSQPRVARLTTATAWVPVREYPDAYVRLSRARTTYSSSVQRNSVEFGGCALEFTTKPEVSDPLRAITMFLLLPEADASDGISWFSLHKPASVHDFRKHEANPARLSGYFSELTDKVDDEELLALILGAIRETIILTFGDNGL